MFGKNEVRPSETTLDGTQLRVQEVFYTLQGEGPFSGHPAVFVRLAGCNLRCHFCDTEFESGYNNLLSIPHILKAIDAETEFKPERRKLVVLTGGEPLIQNVIPLINALIGSGTEQVQIETAGTSWVPGLDELVLRDEVVIVCSPKTPRVHPKITEFCFDWKYVVREGETSPADGLPNKSTQLLGKDVDIYRDMNSHLYGGTTWISPCDDHNQEKNIRNMVHARDICLEHGYRLSLQTHKIVNVR